MYAASYASGKTIHPNNDSAFLALYDFSRQQPEIDTETRIFIQYDHYTRSHMEIGFKVAGLAQTQFPGMFKGECRLVLLKGKYSEINQLNDLGIKLRDFGLSVTRIDIKDAEMPNGSKYHEDYHIIRGFWSW